MQTGDIQLIKDMNERLVLNLIRQNKLISGAQLANITGMQASTIAKLLKALEAKSLILNRGKGESTQKGGKRPFLWSLNTEIGYVVGIELSFDYAMGVLLDLEGNILQRSAYPNRTIILPNDLADLAMHVANDLTKSQGVDMSQVLGIGLGVPGIVNVDEGTIIEVEILPHSNIELRKMLMERCTCPVFIENNVNAAAMGEKWLGRGQGVAHFIIVGVYIDRGLGALGLGLVLWNELYYGVNYAAGELNIRLPALDVTLRARRNQLTEGHILRNYIDAIDKLDIHILIDAAKKGDAFALDYFNRLGHQIGREVSQAVGLINPEKLIIEGEVAELDEIVIEPIRAAIDLEMHSVTSTSLKIEPGTHGRHSVSIGAASIVLNDIFKPAVVAKSTMNYFESPERKTIVIGDTV